MRAKSICRPTRRLLKITKEGNSKKHTSEVGTNLKHCPLQSWCCHSQSGKLPAPPPPNSYTIVSETHRRWLWHTVHASDTPCLFWPGGMALLDPTRHLLHKALLLRLEEVDASLIHRNKHKESIKTRKQKNMFQIKEQDKTSETRP